MPSETRTERAPFAIDDLAATIHGHGVTITSTALPGPTVTVDGVLL